MLYTYICIFIFESGMFAVLLMQRLFIKCNTSNSPSIRGDRYLPIQIQEIDTITNKIIPLIQFFNETYYLFSILF